jgi:integrase
MAAVYLEKFAGSDNWFAMMELPLRLRNSGIDGLPKRRFKRSTETGDRKIAENIARAYATRWQAAIDVALNSSDFYLRKYAKLLGLSEAPSSYEELLKHIGGVNIGEVMSHDLGDGRTVETVVETGQVRIVPTPPAPVHGGNRFASLIQDWIKERVADGWTPKTADMRRSDVEQFAKAFPYVESVTLDSVSDWIGRLKGDEMLSAATIDRKLGALRGYWQHIRRANKVPRGTSPFDKTALDLPKKKSNGDDAREAFSADDVVKLHSAALKGFVQTMRDGKPCTPAKRPENRALADLIYLAAYTGGRIESLCSLGVEDCHFNSSVKDENGKTQTVSYFRIRHDKSEAGKRDVPIHPMLAPVLRRLIGKRKSGFVFADLPEGKYGRRSHTIGNDFSDLKIALGFDARFVFHSFRRTVSTLLQNAGVPEPVAANIVGHKITTLTYGLYSAGASLPVKYAAIKKLRYPREMKADGREPK